MVMYNQLPIYRDAYSLLLEIYQVSSRFPRDFKYTLGQDMKRDSLALFRDLYGANVSIENRNMHLDRFLTAFELLKVELRLCVDLNVLPIKKLAQLSLIMDSIAKQATAWRRSNQSASAGARKEEKKTFINKG